MINIVIYCSQGLTNLMHECIIVGIKIIGAKNMFIFLRLLLAHFIGDFPLQSNSIYKLKYRGLKGIVPHSVIIAGSLILFSWPYLKLPGLWGFICVVTIAHLLQDWMKMVWKKGQKENFCQYLLDQFLHIGVIATVFLTGLKNLKPPEQAVGKLASFYNTDKIIVCLILLIVATYNGNYMIETFKYTFLKTRHNYTLFESWYGMFERAMIVLIFLYGGVFLMIIPFVFCLRFPVYRVALKNKLDLSEEFVSFLEISLSGTIALAAGIILYLIEPSGSFS
ncbi:MAG: DUF3307 domain-containing protein [Candidatus Omnitrophica bacterium]|nr:DUF3307 domain-containing protein [Candidatus Omnitrophota bacterium]